MKNRIVLDTNCLILSLPPQSEYHAIWVDLVNGKYLLCVSNSIIEEYDEIITKFWGHDVASTVISYLINSRFVEKIDPTFDYELITKDPDDNKFVNCAIMANARFIVSEDHHFNILKEIDFPHIDVIRIDDFLNILAEIDEKIN
jgi:putative PIN family toxin of toxin-antitoxin system